MLERILITGGAGFIGSHVVEKIFITKKNADIYIIDDLNNFYDPKLKRQNLKNILTDKRIHLHIGDITDWPFVNKTIQQIKPQYVIHLAARAGVRPSFQNPELYARVNILGTIHILEAIKNFKIKNFIFGSSSSVYGNTKTPFSEENPVGEQMSPYAISKYTAETYCRLYAKQYGIPITCLRFFTVYGPRQRPDLAIHTFMKKMIAETQLEIFGTGSSARDYTYVEDIVDGIYKSISKPFPFQIINLGSANPVSLKKLITHLEKTLHKKAKIKYRKLQQGDLPKTFADISKAKKLLKWEPKTSIHDGLTKMAEWIQRV